MKAALPLAASVGVKAGVLHGSITLAVELAAKTETPSWHENFIFAPALSRVAHESTNESFGNMRASELVNSAAEGVAGGGVWSTEKFAD
ncbi:MAG TPA: hypothetical protein VJ043_03115, partial [Candidatus Paceibacterota bacterium]|nr:hypothetical protein [Candidatus Paceibacterota bacterium]